MATDSLLHASLDAECQVLGHEAGLNGLDAHCLQILSKGGQVRVI